MAPAGFPPKIHCERQCLDVKICHAIPSAKSIYSPLSGGPRLLLCDGGPPIRRQSICPHRSERRLHSASRARRGQGLRVALSAVDSGITWLERSSSHGGRRPDHSARGSEKKRSRKPGLEILRQR